MASRPCRKRRHKSACVIPRLIALLVPHVILSAELLVFSTSEGSLNFPRLIPTAVILFWAVNVAPAAAVPVANPNFAIDVLTCVPGISTCSTYDAITSWAGSTLVGAAFGVYRPGTESYPGGVPIGVNVAYLQELGATESISQTLSSTLRANDTYTLSFYVGLRKDINAIPPSLGCYGFNVALMAGGNILNTLLLSNGSVSCSLVTTGAFTKMSFSYTSGSNPPGLGSPLQIVLTAQGTGSIYEPAEIDFAEITLTDTPPMPYYFSQLAFGGGYQTTLTYINYSPQTVTCVTNFYSDTGAPLSIPFNEGTISTRTDVLQPGQSIHDQSTANLSAAVSEGWGQATCSGPVQASVLYRFYQSGAPVGEAGVNAETAPTNTFVTFAQSATVGTANNSTGVAYANPSTTQSATITLTAISATGAPLGSRVVILGPLAHGSANLGPLLGLSSFTGFVEITSTIPIISVSLNAEAFPVFSSLPPGDLPSSTTLVN